MRGRFLAIAALWIFAAGLSVYAALLLHNTVLPLASFIFAAGGTLLLRPRRILGTLHVLGETIEDQMVESSLGFSVQMTRSSLVYREQARSITVLPFTEPGKPVAFRFAPNIQLSWDAPDQDDPLPPKKQEEIRYRIVRCLSFLLSAQLSRNQRRALRKKRKEMQALAEKTPPNK